MRKIFYLLLVSLSFISCLQQPNQDLQLISPDATDVDITNKETGVFMDGIYPASIDSTSFSYQLPYSTNTSYFIDYKPVIVPSNFKILRLDYNMTGRPVIDVELHQSAHKTWYDATLKAYINKEPLFIVIDNKVIAAPVLNNGPIAGGRLQISGDLSEEEVQKMIEGIKEKYASPKLNQE